jgi:hypothetical protein
MLCDARCAEPLADVIPRNGFIVADPPGRETGNRVVRHERPMKPSSERVLHRLHVLPEVEDRQAGETAALSLAAACG